jgi:hypothetical protein
MRSALAVGVGALLLALHAGSPQHAAAPRESLKASPKPLLAFVWRAGKYRLAWTDPAKLTPLRGRSIAVGSPLTSTLSPSGKRVALVYKRDIRIVDATRMRIVRHFLGSWDGLTGVTWPTAGRLLVVGGGASVVQALANGRTVWERFLDGIITAWRPAPDGVVLLLNENQAIGPTTLATVSSAGDVRTVKLDRIQSGTVFPPPGDPSTPPLGQTRTPGLALDAAVGRVYVVGAGEPLAEVDLATMTVAYHELSHHVSFLGRLHDWLEPKASAKGANGPFRTASVLPGGMIAVSGWDESAWLDQGGDMVMTSTPAGLQLIDPHDWSVRTLDRTVSSVEVRDGLLFGFGTAWDSRQSESVGRGLDVYSATGERLFHLFGSDRVYSVWGAGGRAYAEHENATAVIDLENGRVLGASRGGHPAWPLVP